MKEILTQFFISLQEFKREGADDADPIDPLDDDRGAEFYANAFLASADGEALLELHAKRQNKALQEIVKAIPDPEVEHILKRHQISLK